MGNVRLADLVAGMGAQSEGITSYLHRPTGRIVTVGGDGAPLDPEKAGDAGEKREILTGSSDYVQLPDRMPAHEYRMMEQFAFNVRNPTAGSQLISALKGRGQATLDRFKDEVARLKLDGEWSSYREHAYRRIANDWCGTNAVELAPDS